MRLGYRDHPVVREETEALAERILADRGIECGAMSYSLLSHCHMALPKLLLCFAEGMPPEERSPAVRGAIELIAQALIARQVYVYVPGNRKAWQKLLAQAPKRADLPPENEAAVFNRMRAERAREAKAYRSEGEEEALKIRAETDLQAASIRAEAAEEAQRTRGEGDAEALRIYAAAYQGAEEFYGFTRTLEAYEASLKENATLVLPADSEFFRFLKGTP